MDNVGIHVPARQIREFCAFNVNNTVRPSFSQDTITANGMQIFGHFWQKQCFPLRQFQCSGT
jgi:hypothetical protein